MKKTLTSKGQVTIPKAVQDHLGITPGSEVHFKLADNGDVVIEKANGAKPSGRFASLRGSAGPGMSTDELMALMRGGPE